MKFRFGFCLLAMLAGCGGGSDGGDAPPLESARRVSAAVPEDTVAAVLQSTGQPELAVRYKWESPPIVGQSTTLHLDISTAGSPGAVALDASSSSLQIVSRASASLIVPEPGQVLRHSLTLTASKPGWTDLELQLRAADPDVAEVRYTIPVLVVEREAAAKPSDKSDPTAKTDNPKP